MWEYLRIHIATNNSNKEINYPNGFKILYYNHYSEFYSIVNDLGAEGWEMISETKENNTGTIFFKRPLTIQQKASAVEL